MAFRTLLSKRPFLSFPPLLLEMRFHANLSLRKLSRVFTLPSRWSRASLHVNHAQPPDIFQPPPPRSSCCATRATPIQRRANESLRGQNRQFKDRSSLVPFPSVFLLVQRFFFFFFIEISSSILFFDDFWIEKRII